MMDFRNYQWDISYSTAGLTPEGQPVDILHDFYIPVLKRAVKYDRMAGYFRSSSLAAASCGFTAFIENGSKMRLIMGADVTAEDAQAIILGLNHDLYNAKLLAELDFNENTTDEVKRGVELLAFMVAKGILEVRVAFRVHRETKVPIASDSTADGYVHMKWGVFTDMFGNRVYISGSLNESKTALTMNAENIDVHLSWEGAREVMRIDKVENEFNNLWNDNHPAFRVMTLPEAVNQKLIKIASRISRPVEFDGTSVLPKTISPPPAIEVLKALVIRDAPRMPSGKYVGMCTTPIDPWPHQKVVARRIIDNYKADYLLCDEVGLGKTIEAGLVIRSLYLSGLASRIVISPPAGLTKQWQTEMAKKFFLPFARVMPGARIAHAYIHPCEREAEHNNTFEPSLLIVSSALLYRRQREFEASRAVDLMLIDEAHYARRKNPRDGSVASPDYGKLYRMIYDSVRKRSGCLMLATATPMQLDSVEVHDLIKLTERVGQFLNDPTLMNCYFNCLGKLVCGNRLEQDDWEFLKGIISTLGELDANYWVNIQRYVIEQRFKYAIEEWLKHGRPPSSPGDISGVKKLIFMSSPLSRVMLRHTRPLLEKYKSAGKLTSNLARRNILPLPNITFNSQESLAYDDLREYCIELENQITSNNEAHWKSLRLYLSFLRLRFASSLKAIKLSLERRLEKVKLALRFLAGVNDNGELFEDTEFEDVLEEFDGDSDVIQSFIKNRSHADLEWEAGKLAEMLENLQDIKETPSKMKELFRLLDNRRRGGRLEQTVLFTRFTDTLEDILERLQAKDGAMLIGTYSGKGGTYYDPVQLKMVCVDREEIKRKFLRHDIDMLLCTDAAAEGLNLQTANLLINYDLPWNPMKVEQRIGRIDRIGQIHNQINVVNFCYVGSAEEVVYGRLWDRLSQAGIVVGTQQLSMLPVSQDEFNELASGRLTPDALEKLALERAKQHRRQTESMEIPAEDLYKIYERMSDGEGRKLPVSLDDIWDFLSNSRYLNELGCVNYYEPQARTMILNNFLDYRNGSAITTSSQTYEFGKQDLKHGLYFATYGNPCFDSIIDEFSKYETSVFCVRKIEIAHNNGFNLVGYVVAVNDAGIRSLKLIKSYDELKYIKIDEERQINEEEVRPFVDELRAFLHTEFGAIIAADRIRKRNIHAGKSHEILVFIAAAELLRRWIDNRSVSELFCDNYTNFCQQLMDETIVDVIVRSNIARAVKYSVFKLQIPQLGNDAYLTVDGILKECVIELLNREAGAIKENRYELRNDMVLKRINRKIEELENEILKTRTE